MTEKCCRKCLRLLPLDMFATAGRRVCMECVALQQSAWYDRNKKRLRREKTAYMRAWRARNPGYWKRRKPQKYNPEVQRRARETYMSKPGNRERANAQSLAYYRAHRDEIAVNKKRKKLERALRVRGED